LAGGYDHNFVLQKPNGQWGPAATLHEARSGRTLDILTTQPGLQFYSGNYIAGTVGKGEVIYGKHAGCCLETQHFPDSPNHPSFPSTMLRPGEQYHEATILRFSAV
jgi:aldose 1-epimerase